MSVALFGAACATGASSTTTAAEGSSTTEATAPTTTTLAALSTTTEATAPITTTLAALSTTTAPGPPPFFRYGAFGVVRVEAGRETTLLDEPVGGCRATVRVGWCSGTTGSPTPSSRERCSVCPQVPASQWSIRREARGGVINLDGRLAVMRFDDAEDWCPHPIRVYDLETGDPEDFVACAGDGDYGLFPGSYGGGLFVGVDHFDSGSCRTNICITFWDSSGGEIDIPANPYPCPAVWHEFPDWTPCELGALVSPDGRLLAYRFRPDNKWPCPEYDDVLYEDWLKESRKIPGEVVVLDIETGSVVFRAPSEADERLYGFDGRFIVLTATDRRWDVPMDQLDPVVVSTIVDITGTNPDHTVDGPGPPHLDPRLIRNPKKTSSTRPYRHTCTPGT